MLQTFVTLLVSLVGARSKDGSWPLKVAVKRLLWHWFTMAYIRRSFRGRRGNV